MAENKLIFDTHGNERQKDVCRMWVDPTVTDIVYGGSKGSGKSYLGCSLIFGDALTYPETHYFIARKKLTDLRKYTIPSIHEVLSAWGIDSRYYSFNGQDNFFTLYNKSRIYLLDAKPMPGDPHYYRFGSMQMTRGMIEEAGEFEEGAKNNLAASIGRWKNDTYNLSAKLLQTCNPAKNYLYRDYYKKHKDGTLEHWKRFVQALPSDNKMLPDGYLENLQRTLSANEKERLLYGNWEYDDDPSALCDYDAICDLFGNDHVRGTGKRYISADLAMQGRDKFIAGYWDGYVCNVAIDKGKSTGLSIETDLKQLMIRHSVPRSQVIADSDGLGAYLESYLTGIKTFHGGSRANSTMEMFGNIKDECAFKLAEMINKREIKIVCTSDQRERIIEEVEQLKRDNLEDPIKKKSIIKKDKMKELLGRSPDYLDMLLMRMYFEITTPSPKLMTVIE